MSSILDALNKSEAERQRAQPPGWNSPMQFGQQPPPRRRRWWWLVLAVLAALALAWMFGVFSPNPDPAGSAQTAATRAGLEAASSGDPGAPAADAVETDPDSAYGQPSRTTESPGNLDLAGTDRIPDAVRRLRAQAQARAETDQGTQMDRLRQLAQLRRGEITRAELAGDAAASRPVTAEQAARAEQEIRMLAEALGEDPDEITDDMIEEMAIAIMAAEEAGLAATPADAEPGGALDPGTAPAAPQTSGARAAGDAPRFVAPVPVPAPAPTPPPARVISSDAAPAAEQASIRNESMPLINELPFNTRRELPAMNLTMHLYSDDPARRMVLLNGARAGDGDELDNGLRILAIRPDGVAMEFQGTRFLLPARP